MAMRLAVCMLSVRNFGDGEISHILRKSARLLGLHRRLRNNVFFSQNARCFDYCMYAVARNRHSGDNRETGVVILMRKTTLKPPTSASLYEGALEGHSRVIGLNIKPAKYAHRESRESNGSLKSLSPASESKNSQLPW